MRNWTAAGLGAIAAVTIVAGAGVIAAPEGFGHREARMGGGRGPMLGAFCGPQAAERLEDGLTAFESFAKFEGQQQASWVVLRDTLREAQPQVAAICGEIRGIRAGNSMEKLATVQGALTKAAAVASELQPAYANFYTTLDDAQKRTLDDMFELPGRFMRHG